MARSSKGGESRDAVREVRPTSTGSKTTGHSRKGQVVGRRL